MIISRNLLAEFYPGIRDLTLEQISEAFFKIGIEIEGFEKIVEPTGLYYGVIRSFGKVEGSDKLNMCKVFVPVKDETFDIVCGASNVSEGLGVVVALPGAKLGNGKVEITKREFGGWGVTSCGMLCSYGELYQNSLLKDIGGFEKGKIIELSDKWDLGREFRSGDLWLDDWVFDLFIPANRGDLHSAWGLSRELAKILGVPKEELGHGGRYSREQDLWMIKRVLLTNNQKGMGGDTFESYWEGYLYLAFNEYLEGNKRETRKKSGYFRRLRDGFIEGKVVEEFGMRRIGVDRKKVLAFLGLPLDWKCRRDLFVLEDEYAEVPEWREDILDERDVADEILGIFGWDKVRFDPIPTTIGGTSRNSLIMSVERIREFWRDMGFYECTTFNLHAKTEGETTLDNPLSSDHVSLRTHALNELVEVLRDNHCSKRDLYPVFELFEAQTPEPTWTLNIVVPETSSSFPLSGTQLSFGLCDLQSLVRKCLRHLNVNPQFVPWDKSKNLPFIGSKCRLSILDGQGKTIGEMGYLNPMDSVRLWGCHCVLEFHPPKKYIASAPSKYPPVYKDISIAVEKTKGITLKTITSSLRSDHFISWRLVEKYEKEGVLSYLLRVRLQSFEGTLTGAEIQRNMDQLVSCIGAIEGVEIR